MKTLKSLCLMLLIATGVLAQPNPDNMFISGYVTDSNGGAVNNHLVCVQWASNSPALPSDSACTTTNANGYYYLDIPNGSLTGPNVTFEVSTYDPCSFLPLSQNVSNNQGTVDQATVSFSICAVNASCSVYFTSTNDSINGTWVFDAIATGTAPFTYDWWVDGSSYSTETVSHMFNGGTVGVFLTMTDANGCTSTYGDTLYLNGNPNGCGAQIVLSTTPLGDTSLTVMGTGVSPFTYLWNTGETTAEITGLAADSTYCVTVTDAIGCSYTACATVGNSNNNCSAGFYYTTGNPNSQILTGEDVNFHFSGSSANTNYYFWTVQGIGLSLSSQDMDPVFNFPVAGSYEVCVEVFDSLTNCSDTECLMIEVLSSNSGNCDASFTINGPTPNGHTFAANVLDPNLDYYWTINGQQAGAGYYAYLSPQTNGVFTVCLSVTDTLNQCYDTQCQTLTIGSNTCSSYISGMVYAGSNNYPLDHGVVYLITHDTVTNQLTAIDSALIDSSNFFIFGPLDCGDYLIKAAAYPGSQYYSNHIPTYHGNSPFWGFAQTISLNQVNIQVTTDVTLIAANNPGGPGFIGGNVTQGANKNDIGDPISGMQVMLFDMAGGAIAYTYTDGNGEFGFSNLAYGSYQVYVEALGVQTVPAVVTIGPDQPSVDDVNIIASETLISTGIAEFDFDGAIGDVYPNPVTDVASIKFNLETALMLDISVLDLAGRTVSTRTVSVGNGETTVNLASDDLKGGYYFLNIQDVDGNFSVTRKFLRVD